MSDTYYIWLIIAFVLMAAEIIGTDFFLLFLGCAALITAFVSYFVNISFWTEATIFGVLGLILVVVWFILHRKKKDASQPNFMPNSGLKNYIGTKTTVCSVDEKGFPKIEINDTVFLACGQNFETFAEGDLVEVVGVDHNDRLQVKKS